MEHEGIDVSAYSCKYEGILACKTDSQEIIQNKNEHKHAVLVLTSSIITC